MYHLRRKVHFVIMASVFDTPAEIHTIYDLKGSLVGRSATEKERTTGGVLKDNDLISDKRKLHLGSKKAEFIKQLKKDAYFLASMNIMDYSLLIGIHERRKRGATHSVPAESSSYITQSAPSPQVDSAAISSKVHSNTPFRRSISVSAGATSTNSIMSVKSQNSVVSTVALSVSDDIKSSVPFSGNDTDGSAPLASTADEAQALSHEDVKIEIGALQPSAEAAEEGIEMHDLGEEEDEEEYDDDDSQSHDDINIDDGDSEVEDSATTSSEFDLDLPSKSRLSLKVIKRLIKVDSKVKRDLVKAASFTSFSSTDDKRWTTRRDGGINSRMLDNSRGDEIYFVGVIDILQQYNMNKFMETIIKVSYLVGL